ncbi:MAG: SLC13 family permease, partial [Dehalococcoidia bacterium]
MIDLITTRNMRPGALAFRFGLPVAVFLVVILAPNPDGLTDQGQRALAVMAAAVVLWATETLHIAVTGMVGIVMLVLVNAVDDVEVALYGFSQPVTYFLLGILTLGLAVHQSGLAERMAVYLIRLAAGSPKKLYVQMLASFALLTFALPSASTRGAIMVHVYEQVLEHWKIEKSAPLNKAVMMAMGSLNRLGSTALLAGGITPVVASALIAEFGLIDDFSWTRWFILMALPFYAILIAGGVAVYLMYRSGFTLPEGIGTVELKAGPLTGREIRAGLIALGTALLWFTDFAHGLPPVVPALIAMTVILLPGVGLLSWREFEQNIGWTNIFVIASSLSLANALIVSGAAAWFAD